MAKQKLASIIPIERIASRIYVIRRRKIMFDFDLAELYAVDTKVLDQAVSRNDSRFPEDFMFRSKRPRWRRSTGSQKHRDPRFPPRAFTEEGVAMLSGILGSKRAVEVNIDIMRAFVRLRDLLATNEELARKVSQHDREIAVLFEHVQNMLAPVPVKKNPIGFIHPKE